MIHVEKKGVVHARNGPPQMVRYFGPDLVEDPVVAFHCDSPHQGTHYYAIHRSHQEASLRYVDEPLTCMACIVAVAALEPGE